MRWHEVDRAVESAQGTTNFLCAEIVRLLFTRSVTSLPSAVFHFVASDNNHFLTVFSFSARSFLSLQHINIDNSNVLYKVDKRGGTHAYAHEAGASGLDVKSLTRFLFWEAD